MVCGLWSVVGGWSVGGGFVLRRFRGAQQPKITSEFRNLLYF